MIKIKGHRILVKPKEIEEFTEGGIYLPDPIREQERIRTGRGIVLQLGATCYSHPDLGIDPWCQEGDMILFAARGARQVIDDETDERLWVINDEDVIAVLVESGDE